MDLVNELDEFAIVEVVVLRMTTSLMPITDKIDQDSTNDKSARAKAVYDYVQSEINKLREELGT